jgi:hypothetical protein
MGDCHGERIRGLAALESAPRQEHASHHCDLRLLGVAGAHKPGDVLAHWQHQPGLQDARVFARQLLPL